MDTFFIGSEALAAGAVTSYELRRFHRRILPDVYGPRWGKLSLEDRIRAAWLWSRREGVVSGLPASALSGAKWVDAETPVELNWPNHRPPKPVAVGPDPINVIVRADTIDTDEVVRRRGMAVTSAERTAFDLARRGTIDDSVARLDALARATGFTPADVLDLAAMHPHVRGLRRIACVLDLVDSGAESPQETWLRLLLIRAGYPQPQTQIPLLGPDGYPIYRLDMGWADKLIAVEYDGDGHREKSRWRSDIVRSEYIAHLGWKHIRVVAGQRERDILHRVERAWTSSSR